MDNKPLYQTLLGLAWFLLGLVLNNVGAQENPAGVQQGVRLVETRADDHSGTNEPPRDKRFFQFSGYNRPQSFQPTVSFDQLNNYNQQNYNQPENQFGGRTGSRNFVPDVIDTHANNQYFNNFNQMMSSTQFRNFNGRTGNRQRNNMWPWGYGDWSQWGWPSNDGFWGRSYGSQGQQNQWGPWGGGQAGGNTGSQWNQFGGRSVSGPRNQFGGRSGRIWPSYNQYGYGYPYGNRR